MLHVLPPEVIRRIIYHARRNLPAPRSPVGWSDLHQQDLTVLLRVNSGTSPEVQTFYHLTAPILYEEAVVQDIGLFLHGYNAPSPTSLDKVLFFGSPLLESAKSNDSLYLRYHLNAKRNLLKMTRRLHLVMHLCPQEDDGAWIGWDEDGRLVADSFGMADFKSMRSAEMLGELMTQLETLSFQTWDDGRWWTYWSEYRNGPYSPTAIDHPAKPFEDACSDLGRPFLDLGARYICHSQEGSPFGVGFTVSVFNFTPPKIHIQHGMPLRPCIPLQVWSGTVSRHTCDVANAISITSGTQLSGLPTLRKILGLGLLSDELLEEHVSAFDSTGTKVELYWYRWDSKEKPDSPEQDLRSRVETMSRLNDELDQYLNSYRFGHGSYSHLSWKALKGNVRLYYFDDAPVCEACGGGPEDEECKLKGI